MLSTTADIIKNNTDKNVPVIGFAGFSGSGKTTLLKQVLTQLKNSGLKLAVIKHSHHDIELDKPGKDSYELRHSGACQLVLATANRMFHFTERDQHSEPSLVEALVALNFEELDLILVEGFRDEAFSKIEIHRPSYHKPLLCEHDQNIIAIASDDANLTVDRPLLDLNKPSSISHFILTQLK